jgi:hypothetical protein
MNKLSINYSKKKSRILVRGEKSLGFPLGGKEEHFGTAIITSWGASVVVLQ